MLSLLRSSTRCFLLLSVCLGASGCSSNDSNSDDAEGSDVTDQETDADEAATETESTEEQNSEEDNTDEASDSETDTSAESSETDPAPAATDTDSEPAESNTSNRERLPESLREACMDMCDGQFGLDCAPAGISIETCDLQCVAAVSNQRDFCIEEYTARTRCLADGGFECVNDNPVARSTCAGEQVAYSECVQDLPCKMYCAELVETGCADDNDACLEECMGETNGDDLSCDIRWDGYVACVGQWGASCEDGTVIPNETCIRSLFDAYDCRNDSDVCKTWCDGARALGCGGGGCVTNCEEAVADPTCGTDYERLLDCGIRYGYVECTDDGLMTNTENILCDSEMDRYLECIEQSTR